MPTGVLIFGAYRLKLPSGELRKHGTPLRLSGHSLSILLILLEKPGEIVTRDEIKTRLWPSDTFVDFDHGLNTAMKKLRAVLGDAAEQPRFIETVPRLGYRFIAAVEVEGGKEVEEVKELTEAKEATAEKRAEASGEQLPTQSGLGEPRRPEGIAGTAVAERVAAASQFRTRRFSMVLAILLAVAGLVWIVYREGQAESNRTAASAGRTMLAVLPFENLTGDAGQEYVSDGMTEELITELGGIQPERLGVIARTSVMGYKHTSKRIDQIGTDLNVSYVLEGSLRQAGERVRITAQLIRVSDQAHVWAQEFDSAPRDVLMMEEDAARKIAAETQVRLSPVASSKTETVDPEAYALYLKGRYFWNQRTNEGLHKAIDYFQRAIEKQPQYGRAYAGLADAYLLLNDVAPAQSLKMAREAARKALELNPSLAEAHASIALAGPNDIWDWANSEREYLRAIALDPNYATAHHWYADGYLAPIGRTQEAVAELRIAERLDPLSPIIGTDLGKDLYFARRYDEAMAQLDKVLEISPNYPSALEWKRWIQITEGKFEDAMKTLEIERATLAPGRFQLAKAYILARTGKKQEARALLAECLRLARSEYVNPGEIAGVYLGLGENDETFVWLEKAYEARSPWLTGLKVAPLLDSLREDPRYPPLARRVGLIQ